MIRWQELQLQTERGELHRYSEKLDADFLVMESTRQCLAPLARGRTLWLLNWTWPDIHPQARFPDDYDTYVMIFYREPPDWLWFYRFAEQHPNQEIIVAHEIPSTVTPYANLKFVEHQHLHYKIRRALHDFGGNYRLPGDRTYRISSLCNKPSLYKTLVSAWLDLYHAARDDVIMSWNLNLQRETCGSMRELDRDLYDARLNELRDHYHATMAHKQIKIDTWQHGHYENCDWTNTRAYRESLINLTNETYVNGIFPGPWISEKTRKPLLAGTAVIPVAMHGVYQQLERFGFRCDWPWDPGFDQEIHDFARIIKILDVLDGIFAADIDELHRGCQDSIQHNFDWARSQDLDSRICEINSQAVAQYLNQR